MTRRPPRSTLFPYTTLFRSRHTKIPHPCIRSPQCNKRATGNGSKSRAFSHIRSGELSQGDAVNDYKCPPRVEKAELRIIARLQQPSTGEQLGGVIGAIGGAAAVTAAESPELIPVVAPITAKAGAVVGKKAEEEIRQRIAMQEGENDMKTCFKDGWKALHNISNVMSYLDTLGKEVPTFTNKSIRKEFENGYRELAKTSFADFITASIKNNCIDRDEIALKDLGQRLSRQVDSGRYGEAMATTFEAYRMVHEKSHTLVLGNPHISPLSLIKGPTAFAQ